MDSRLMNNGGKFVSFCLFGSSKVSIGSLPLVHGHMVSFSTMI